MIDIYQSRTDAWRSSTNVKQHCILLFQIWRYKLTDLEPIYQKDFVCKKAVDFFTFTAS